MGSLFSMFSKLKQNPNMGVWNGHKFTNPAMEEREEYFGGNNRTKKNDNKYRISKKSHSKEK